MKFIQYDNDGSCDLNFSEEEIKIIVKNKKLHFTPEALRDFGNCLTHMVARWNLNFNEELKNKITDNNSVIDLSNDQRTK